MKVKLNMRDTFSKCVQSVEKEVNEKQLAQIEQLQINEVPISIFDKTAQINFTWIIEEIEIL